MGVLEQVAEVDKLFVKQRFAMMLNHYDISLIGADGATPAEPICYVRQKRMKIREEINFFASGDESTPILRLKKRSVLEFHGATDVLLPDGTVIGRLQKVFGLSVFRSTWKIKDAGDVEVATARERSLALSILRRLWGAIPYIGEIPFFIPFHFDILIGDKVVGSYNRPFSGLTDRYVLDLSGDTARHIDRRVAMGLAIALDALQDR